MIATDSKYWYFKNFFFSDLVSDEDYASLDLQSEFLKCQKDGFIYFQGQNDDSVYFLKRGYVKIGSYDSEGREVILDVLQPGDVFGNVHRLGGGSGNEFAQALSEVAACQINTDRFRQLLTANRDLSVQVIKTVGERVSKLERKLVLLAFRDARTRVIEFLRDFATDFGHVHGSEIWVDNFLTQQDIANLTASSRQLVSTILNSLKESGQITYDRKHLKIQVPLAKLA